MFEGRIAIAEYPVTRFRPILSSTTVSLPKGGRISKIDLMTIEAEDILASRGFSEEMPDDEQQI